jgi:hypothetical protein
MSDHYQYLLVGLLIYLGIAGIFLLILGFNRQEDPTVSSNENPPQPDGKNSLLP